MSTFSLADSAYCEKIDSEDCPNSLKAKRELNFGKVETAEWKTIDEYLKLVLNEAIDQMDLIISLGLTALTCLIFTLGYYCINRARKEGPLIAKVSKELSADEVDSKVRGLSCLGIRIKCLRKIFANLSSLLSAHVLTPFHRSISWFFLILDE